MSAAFERVAEQRRRLFGKDYAKRQREVWPCSPTIQPQVSNLQLSGL